jgi:hypothetical protein
MIVYDKEFIDVNIEKEIIYIKNINVDKTLLMALIYILN